MSFPFFRRSWDVSEEFLRSTFNCNSGAPSSLHPTPNQVAPPAPTQHPPHAAPGTGLFGQACCCNRPDFCQPGPVQRGGPRTLRRALRGTGVGQWPFESLLFVPSQCPSRPTQAALYPPPCRCLDAERKWTMSGQKNLGTSFYKN